MQYSHPWQRIDVWSQLFRMLRQEIHLQLEVQDLSGQHSNNLVSKKKKNPKQNNNKNNKGYNIEEMMRLRINGKRKALSTSSISTAPTTPLWYRNEATWILCPAGVPVSATNSEVAMATGTRGLCPPLSQPCVTELMTEMPVRCRLGEDGNASKCFALWGRGWRLADLRELDRIVPWKVLEIYCKERWERGGGGGNHSRRCSVQPEEAGQSLLPSHEESDLVTG